MYHGIASSIDPHSRYLNKKELLEFERQMTGRFAGVGMLIMKLRSSYVVVTNVYKNTPAEMVGIQRGDFITHIDNVPTTSIDTVEKAVSVIRGDPGTKVRLRILRDGVEGNLEFVLTREDVAISFVEEELILHNNKTFGLIKLDSFGDGLANNLSSAFFSLKNRARNGGEQLSGIIVNLENNPGGRLDEAVSALDLFLDAKSFVLEYGNDNEARVPMELMGSALNKIPGDITDGIPILVVVNEGSASASEIFAGAMKLFGRALVAGTSKTFGKGSIQGVYPAPGGKIIITVYEYLVGTEDNWIPVQCVGVTPDVFFTYPEIEKGETLRECELSGAIPSIHEMPNAPEFVPLKEKDPAAYNAGVEMLEALKSHMAPILKREKGRLKKLEESAIKE